MDNAKNPLQDASSKAAVSAGRQMDQVVVDLHIARRNVLIYPAAHDQVKQSLLRAYKSLSAALSREPHVTLTVMKEGLSMPGRVLGANPSVQADLAGVLKRYQVAALTFSKGLAPKELFVFLKLITTEREQVLTEGGIEAMAARRPMPHIRIQTVDYRRLQMTEEEEIQRGNDPSQEGSVWQAFVDDILAGGRQMGSGMPASAAGQFDPAQLADMLNRRFVDSTAAVSHYQKVLADCAADDDEQAALSEGFLYFQRMIKALNPALQKQFLAATFDQCAPGDTLSKSARLIDGLGGELIVEMLRQAGSDGKQISPSLIAFVNKIGVINPTAPPAAGSADLSAKGFSTQEIESLLSKERYETFVDTGYNELLSGLTRKQRKPIAAEAPQAWLAQIENELEPVRINMHVGRAIARLMQACEDMTCYRDWARQLAYLLDDLLESNAFGYLTELIGFVRQQHAHTDSERSRIAELLLNRFNEPQFVTKAIEMVKRRGDSPTSDMLGFLSQLGEPVVLEILDGMDSNRAFNDEDIRVRMLSCVPKLAVKEALARIKDPRPDYVRCMLWLLRKMGDAESAQQVRTLLDHPDFEVRVEALATLLKFKNKWGLIRLREWIDQPMEAGFMPALRLAGAYRVREIVPELTAIVEQRRDLAQREAALRALGQIGDVRALPVLNKLAHRRWSISRKQTGHLRRVAFETLVGYPMEQVKALLHEGLKKKDRTIQDICRRLLREGTRTAGGGDSQTP